MAFSAGEIEAILTLRDQFTRQLKGAAASMTRFGATLTRVGNQARQVGVGLTAGLTLPIVALGVASAKSFATFEKGMNRVAAVTGATGKDFDSLSDKAKELGATTVFSASQAADAMGAFGLAGFEVNEILDVMTGTLNLAAAAQLQVGEAAAITAKVLRGYGIDVSETARVTDVLTKAFTTSNTDLTSLGDAFRSAGPIARSAGISFEQTAAALSLMADAGFQGTLGGTALRGALARLLSPTKQAADILREMGVSTRDATGRLLPLDQIIQQLEPHAGDTGKILQLFGLRAGPAMAALIARGSDALRDQTQALIEAGGTAQKVADIQLKGLTGAFVLFRSAAEGALISIGEQLAPALLDLLDGLKAVAGFIQNTLVPAFVSLPKSFQTGILAFVGMLAVLGPLLAIFGLIATSIGALLPLLASLSLAVAGASVALGAMSAITIGIGVAVGGAIIAFVALLVLLERRFGIVSKIIGEVNASLEEAALITAGLSEKEIENFRANQAMAEGLRGTITEANKLKAAFSQIGLAGTMDQLTGIFDNLNATGQISAASMQMVADQALALEKTGMEIPAVLVALIEQLNTMAEAARAVAEETRNARLSNELATQAFIDQQEALKDLGFVTLPDVIEKLDELAGLQAAAEKSGFDAAEAALRLKGEYAALGEAAGISNVNLRRLTDEIDRNRRVAADALPVLESTALNLSGLIGLVEGVTTEQVRAAQEAERLAEAFDRTGREMRAALRATRVQAEIDFLLIAQSGTASARDIEAAQVALGIAQRRELGLTAREMRVTAGEGTRQFMLMATAIEGSFAQMLIGAKGFQDGFIDIWESIKRTVVNIFGTIVGRFLRALVTMGTAAKGARPGFAQAFGAAGAGGGGGPGGFLASLFGGGPSAASQGPGFVGPPAPAAASPIAGLALSGIGGVAAGELGRQLFGPGKGAAAFGAAAGAAQGAIIGSVVPGIGTAVGAAVGGLAGFFRGLLGPSQAEKAATRDAVDQFQGVVAAGLTEAQKQEAAAGGTSGIRIAIRDAYALLGIGGSRRVIGDLFDAIRSGQTERTVKQIRPILKILDEARQRRSLLDLFGQTGGVGPLLQARHGITGNFGSGTPVMLHGEETVTPGRDSGGPDITINITALDPNGLRKVVEEEVIPMIVDATRGNRLQARTRLRNGLGV